MKKTLLTLFACLGLLVAAQAQIVITEIMYNPPGVDTLLEYLEVHNPGNSSVDVSGWTFEGVTFTFPSGTSLAAGGYLVISSNASDANLQTLGVSSLKWTNSALTNTGEKITLKNAAGNVVDEVDYKAAAPWPTAANSGGSSLVLCDPNSDNSIATNWQAASTPTTLMVGTTQIKANPGAASACGAAPTFPARSIGQVTSVNAGTGVADSVGADVTLEGTVYGVNLRGTNGLQFTLIDDSNNGIAVFSQTATFNYTVQEGDKLSIRGFIGQFNGLIQMLPEGITKLSANNPLVSPAIVVNVTEGTESSLVRINNLTLVDATEWDTVGLPGGFTVRAIASANPNDTVYIRVDNNTDLYAQPLPPTPFNLTGIGGQFDSSSPFTSGYQISPRYIADVSSLVGTKEVDFSAHVLLTPNPASDYLLINSDLRFDRVRVISAQGALLRTLNQPDLQEQLTLTSLPAGTYFLRFEKDGGVWMTRFVKM